MSRGHVASNLEICHVPDITSPCVKFFIFAQIAIFSFFATLQGATFCIQFELPALWRFLAIFTKIGKITTFKGATLGIQFESLALRRFSRFSSLQ